MTEENNRSFSLLGHMNADTVGLNYGMFQIKRVRYVYPFHPIMLLEGELPMETRAHGLDSRHHRRVVPKEFPLQAVQPQGVLAITTIIFHWSAFAPAGCLVLGLTLDKTSTRASHTPIEENNMRLSTAC